MDGWMVVKKMDGWINGWWMTDGCMDGYTGTHNTQIDVNMDGWMGG